MTNMIKIKHDNGMDGIESILYWVNQLKHDEPTLREYFTNLFTQIPIRENLVEASAWAANMTLDYIE